ncbi:UNVERIFIED_CONTAM: uroporphyrinogen-III decarboxylase [Clostridioides difficile]|uniref:uroporphyrinogen decarboxylase family protein n=1 Tax=Clostridioides difficile TaxID=1496 RepID=UPI00082693DB|nr:uroporphyrinogen decarboxylase family protein [Clostridioides difficile]MDO0136279.1 uroporphyrinogen decarboxylase family protein [Clostridioides difficile]MDX5649346.1 uroporphyrinogen decarboxylase family protein [Clostridioides difficile]HBG7259462.1 uroporphyrinogen decarboxylase family protein [Clostridioides difficile]HBY2627060.1 uroporphyrinogen decarboxylase family protein [Clostridioides difficile]HBY3615734.1 uroporphyrinogen decarboxylase family protein [Clostridioides difficil
MELIKTEMTPKERLTLYAKGEEVDRIPTTLSAGETIPVLYGISIHDYYFSSDLMVEVESRMAEDFGADNMGMGLGLRTVAEAIGTKMHYSNDSVAYIEDPVIKDYSQLDNMDIINVKKDGRIPIMIEAFKRLKDKYDKESIIGTGMAGPLTTACALVGTDKFLKDCIKRPNEIRKLMDYSTECIIACGRDLYNEIGITSSLSEPIASANLISKRQFERWAKPYIKRVVDEWSKFQNAPSIHICGKTKDRWEGVLETGISGFWVDNCESLEELKNRLGDKIAIIGNVAPVDILRNGTPEMIEKEIFNCIKQASDSPKGFSLCPGCTTPVGTPKDNIIAFMNVAYKYGQGAKKGHICKGIEKFL